MSSGWQTGKRRPSRPLEIQWLGKTYTGWVSDIFKAIIRSAEAEGRRLQSGWEDLVWLKLQEKYPTYIHQKSQKKGPISISAATILSFAQFVKRRGLNLQVVSTEEAERRAAICKECPLSGPMSGCTKCRAVARAVVRPPSYDLDFGTKHGEPVLGCSACGCYLELKCWILPELLVDEAKQYEWWEKCWVKALASS